MEPVTALDQQQYGELLGWLNGTMVTVRKTYEEDSEQPIRNLFKELTLYSPVIKEFIEYRKNKGKKVTSGILSSMHSIKVEMKKEYEQRPKNEDGVIEVASDAYQQFAKRWREKTEQINKMNHENEFLELFLKTFLGLYRSSGGDFDVINVNEKKLDNFTLLCVKINQLDDLVIDQLYQTYENPEYNEWYYGKYAYVPYRGMGGRKLSRRRKSNSKSKLKRRRKSSHRRQSHRRQRH
jgi:hypothetical protein